MEPAMTTAIEVLNTLLGDELVLASDRQLSKFNALYDNWQKLSFAEIAKRNPAIAAALRAAERGPRSE